jgi:hypothetical protein
VAHRRHGLVIVDFTQPSGLPSMVNGPPMAQHPKPISLTSMPLGPRTLPIPVPFNMVGPIPASALERTQGQAASLLEAVKSLRTHGVGELALGFERCPVTYRDRIVT